MGGRNEMEGREWHERKEGLGCRERELNQRKHSLLKPIANSTRHLPLEKNRHEYVYYYSNFI